MKSIGNNKWLIENQKKDTLKRYKKILLFRRRYDGSAEEYTWEKEAIKNIDKDIIRCGKIIWKSDTDQLNVWKMGNLTLEVTNTKGQWDINNNNGYFEDNYDAFLSMIRVEIGFISEDKTTYQVFAYQGLISKDGIQLNNDKQTAKIKLVSLDYLLELVNAEDVSRHPIDPVKKYFASTYTATTISSTGAGWGINIYQNKIVRIYRGTGIGQERKILSNTVDTITVNAWDTIPVGSYFEILGDNIGTGDGVTVDFITTQLGVGKIFKVWVDDTLKYEGVDYNISDLNKTSIGVKITFVALETPGAGKKVITDYIYWYQGQTFKYFIEKILSLAGITNKEIIDVTFPEKLDQSVEMTWEQTSKLDWTAGIRENVDIDRYEGDVILDDNETQGWRDITCLSGNEISGGLFSFQTSTQPKVQSFIPTVNMKLDKLILYLRRIYFNAGTITVEVRNDNNNNPGSTILDTKTLNILTVSALGTYDPFAIEFSGYRLIAGTKYWLYMYSSISNNGIVGMGYDNNPYSQGKFGYWDIINSRWVYSNEGLNDIKFSVYYHPYYYMGSIMSQTLDCGVNLQFFGKLKVHNILNDGFIKYYTRTQAADAGWPVSFNRSEWNELSEFNEIDPDKNNVKRYIRITTTMWSEKPSTPHLQDFTVYYYTDKYEPTLANFVGYTGKSAIEMIAKLANYEMGFATHFNMDDFSDWQVKYTGNFLPTATPQVWVKIASNNSDESVAGGILTLEDKFVSTHFILKTFIYNDELFGVGLPGFLYKYTKGDAWQSVSNNSVSGTIYEVLIYNNKIYCINQDGMLYEYDFNSNLWIAKTSHITSAPGGMIEYNNKLYMGVATGSNVGKLYEWNDVNAWVEKAPQLGGAYVVSLLVYNLKLYAGMQNGGKLYEWNDVNAWVEKAPQLGGANGIKSLVEYNSKLYGGTGDIGKLYEWNDVNAWVEKAPQFGGEVKISNLLVYNDKLYGGTAAHAKLYEWNDVNAWVEKAPQLYGGDVTQLINYEGSICGVIGNNYGGKVLRWNGTNAWEHFIYGFTYTIYYKRDESSLDARAGWIAEIKMKRVLDNSISKLDFEYFGFIIEDGTYKTKLGIGANGKIVLYDLSEDIEDNFKVAEYLVGKYSTIRLERENTNVSVFVDDKLILQTYSNKKSSNKNVIFGQWDGDYASVETKVDNVRYTLGQTDYAKHKVPQTSSEIFYLPKYYFKPKNSLVETNLELKEDKFIKMFNFSYGWERIYNWIESTFGDYRYIAEPDVELDSIPNSVSKYGKRKLSISGEEFLTATDTNISTAIAKRYYQNYKNPKIRFKLLCKYLFQINLSDEIKVYCKEPSIHGGKGNGFFGDGGRWGDGGVWQGSEYENWFLSGLNTKIVGLTLDLESFTLELDCEEITE